MTDRQVIERDVRCVRCGVTNDLHVHHRVLLSSGRNENPSNKITLCARCHRYVHDHPRIARINGWIVSRYADPATAPVNHFAEGGFVLLDEEYGFAAWAADADKEKEQDQ